MKGYFALLALISTSFLLMYLGAEALQLPVLTDPQRSMSAAGLTAAFTGVGLLIADVVLPTPSSIVMVAHGALFGIAAGTALSLLGRAGSFLLGYYLGKRSSNVARKFVPDSDLANARRALDRWGLVAVAGSRPLPILSETTSIAAGISSMPLGLSLLAAVAGSIPEALLFAVTGSVAGTFLNTSYIFVGIIAVMLLFWAVSSKIKPFSAEAKSGAAANAQAETTT